MKKNSPIDIICKIISVLLSILLVPSIILTVVAGTVTNLIKPETIVNLITDIDYSQFITDYSSELPESYGTGAEDKEVITMSEKLSGNRIVSLSLNSVFQPNGSKADRGDNEHTVTFSFEERGTVSSSEERFSASQRDEREEAGSSNRDKAEQAAKENSTNRDKAEQAAKENSANRDKAEQAAKENSANRDKAEQALKESNSANAKEENEGVIQDGGSTEVILGSVEEFFGESFAEEQAAEIIDEIIKSDVVNDVLGEYAQGVTDALMGKESSLDKEQMKKIIIDNKDEIFDLIEKYSGEKLDREAISETFDQFVNENIDEIMSQLPDPQEIVKELSPETVAIIKFINSGVLLYAFLILDAILVILIFVLRLRDFAGFLWLSVNGIVSGGFLVLIYVVISIAKSIIAVSIPQGREIIEALIGTATQDILISFIVLFVISAVFMTLFFVIKSLKKKKRGVELGEAEL